MSLRNGRRPLGDLRDAHQSVAIAEAMRQRRPTFDAMLEIV